MVAHRHRNSPGRPGGPNIGVHGSRRNRGAPRLPNLNVNGRSAKTLPGCSHKRPARKDEGGNMALVEKKLADLGIVLPTPAAPIANYVGFVRTGSMLVVSGQICLGPGGTLVAKGKLGETVAVEDGQKAARACAINLLAQVKVALGDLDNVVRVVRLGGFIN